MKISNLACFLPANLRAVMHLLDTNWKFKGEFFILLSTLASTMVYLLGKLSLTSVPLWNFLFYWYGLPTIYFFLFNMVKGHPQYKVPDMKKFLRKAAPVLILDALGSFTFFYALSKLDSAIAGFLSQSTILFQIFLGVIILKENFSYWEIPGALVTLSGILIMNLVISNYALEGCLYSLFSSFVWAFVIIFAKKAVSQIEVTILSQYRTTANMIVALLIAGITGELAFLDFSDFKILALGSFFGPFLNITFYYYGLRYMDASKVPLIRTSQAIFVLIGNFLFFSAFPQTREILGGSLIWAGILILLYSKKSRHVEHSF